MMEKRPWFCAGNLPTPWSTLDELKAFLVWAEPLVDELMGLDAEVEFAKLRVRQLEAALTDKTPDPGAR